MPCLGTVSLSLSYMSAAPPPFLGLSLSFTSPASRSRPSHVLPPLLFRPHHHRDLARNWDIDIASSLEDYLDELDGLKISLDGGQTNLNFAEAALLIQVRDV